MPNTWTKWMIVALLESVARPLHQGRRHPA